MALILVTGCAGFIGMHVTERLLRRGDTVIGIDNLNDYYEVSLKEARLAQLHAEKRFTFYKTDLVDRAALTQVFEKHRPERVINLAAQAGVRYSLTNPYAYVDSNLTGFINILEACRHNGVKHLVFASSSSVYGANKKLPFHVNDNVDHPVSLYAATKKANELMAHTYSHLFGLAVTGLRFFTVYGPWGRPDMALFLFTKAILEGRPIDVYNYGNMSRDFTFVDDIADGVVRVLDKIPQPSTPADDETPTAGSSHAPYSVYNIGKSSPDNLLQLIETLERSLGKKAFKNMLPMQPGDVPSTFADVEELNVQVGFRPNIPIEEGVPRFVAWYREYYKV